MIGSSIPRSCPVCEADRERLARKRVCNFGPARPAAAGARREHHRAGECRACEMRRWQERNFSVWAHGTTQGLSNWEDSRKRSVQRAGVKPGWSSAYLEEVAQDLAYLRWIGDERDELHLGSTMGTDQRIDLVDLCNQSGPCRAAGTLRHRPRRGSLGVGGQLLGMRVFPGWRGDTRYVGPALPPRLAS